MKSKISSFALKALPVLLLVAILAPLAAYGQATTVNTTYFDSVFDWLRSILSSLFPIVTGVLVVLFGWNVIKFLRSQDAEKKAGLRDSLMKSLIALFIWFVLFGLIQLAAKIIGVDTGGTVTSEDTIGVNLNPR
jgi:hypothetical protein